MRNPQAFQLVEQARKSNGNPQELFKQVTNGYTPEQMTALFNKAKQFGVSDEYIKQIQGGINTNSVDIKNDRKE